MRWLSFPLSVFSFIPVLAQAPDVPRRNESIIVAGTIEGKRVTITSANLAKPPRRSLTVQTGGGKSTFEGITLQSVLKLAGVRFGEALQGDRLMVFIAVEGAPPPLAVYLVARTSTKTTAWYLRSRNWMQVSLSNL